MKAQLEYNISENVIFNDVKYLGVHFTNDLQDSLQNAVKVF